MTEEEAREWIRTRFSVSRETWAKLGDYVACLSQESKRQNLISASTQDHIWARHIADSAQLLLHDDGTSPGPWLDLGSGAGLPGLVVAILGDRPVVLVESRRKRYDFLGQLAQHLNLNVEVKGQRLETMIPGTPAAVISARAFAPLPVLLDKANRFAHANTCWILPKGRSAVIELETLPPSWQDRFHVKQSLTSPDSHILVGRGHFRG